MSKAQDVIESREATHGDYLQQATLAQNIKGLLHSAPGWHLLDADQQEALDMIAVKMSRSLHGNGQEPDHWLDMAGYATLVHNRLTKGKSL